MLLVNIASAFVTVLTAALIFGIGSTLSGLEPVLLALAAGMFIYIAASDLIPTIHDEESHKIANYQTLILIVGLIVVGLATVLIHDMIDTKHSDNGAGHPVQSHEDKYHIGHRDNH